MKQNETSTMEHPEINPKNNSITDNNNTPVQVTKMVRPKRNNRPHNRNDNNGNNIPAPQSQPISPGNNQNNTLKRTNSKRIKKQPEYKLKEFNPLTRTNKIEKSLLNRLKQKFLIKKVFVINMELYNGKHRTMLLKTKEGTFKYDGGTYVIDSNLAYDNIDSKFLWLDYFQGFSMPIKRNFAKISLELQEGIEQNESYDIEGCTNPMTLKRCLEAKISEGIAKSTGIPEFLKRLNFFVIISMIAILILLFLFVVKTGMLQSIKIPGIT